MTKIICHFKSFAEHCLDVWPGHSYNSKSLNSYENPIRETGNGYLPGGSVEECEVFQII
jgi:hypothetical protein